MTASFHEWKTETEPCLILNETSTISLNYQPDLRDEQAGELAGETANHMRGRARDGMNKKKKGESGREKERERGRGD